MAEPAEAGFTRYFLAGVLFRAALGGLAMAFGAAGVALGRLSSWDWAPFLAGCAGIVLGVLVARPIKGRWDPLTRVPQQVPPSSPSS